MRADPMSAGAESTLIIRIAPAEGGHELGSAANGDSARESSRAAIPSPSAGRLEAYHTATRRWVPLCSGPWWSAQAAVVACRAAGEDRLAGVGGVGRQRVIAAAGLLSEGCRGDEQSLEQCAGLALQLTRHELPDRLREGDGALPSGCPRESRPAGVQCVG
ncbi:hypothetical protein GPECTOR_8g370 [Gonium pectorale]|uniref:SRCR domain-containing protein n=1 Tax=Gonium pectorale TaxID=33097 RepID=A0A150GT70_GONPE|nr:hypothetical protein GPECTOR_8g370 [Gonium pectorale]|eukprot:KXZ53001.1 hypothetical protein GPECTOR_8g370 [Gonium pectorale]